MKVLLTGFNAFGGLSMNPSQEIVEIIASRQNLPPDIEVVAEVLPTEYEAAGDRIQALIRRMEPDVVLGLGVAVERGILNLERVALNLDDAPFPDNAGLCIEGEEIIGDGPTAYLSTLPIGYLKKELQKRGIPVKISNHAGAYVCNHAFYLAQHQIKQLGIDTLCGFIHVPSVSDRDGQATRPETMSLSELVLAIESCLRLLYDFMTVHDE